jgi:hypothetical protein
MANVVFWNVNYTAYLAPGGSTDIWIGGNDWTQYNSVSAGPNPGSAAGASVQIVTQWATSDGNIWVRFTNNGSEGVIFTPKMITVSP